ncbi:hypothetical protein FIBSPDRAFT_1048861 [Athelia psychrophila]|uniref:Uncharacterized protein n=1 Tax=Athelia psychrophila TaxID=1759441 RepID=A0A166D531_9AGAM|nr:hypothetical protein FIBSPDRAFT_1048861 [Fibularhizoctonia sp. CBS 109695]
MQLSSMFAGLVILLAATVYAAPARVYYTIEAEPDNERRDAEAAHGAGAHDFANKRAPAGVYYTTEHDANSEKRSESA